MISPNTPVLEDVRNEFTAFLPGLSGRLSRRFRHWGPEARAEAVAEGVAHAWGLYLSACRRQKSVTPGTLAHYAGGMVESGRKVAGNSTVDALVPMMALYCSCVARSLSLAAIPAMVTIVSPSRNVHTSRRRYAEYVWFSMMWSMSGVSRSGPRQNCRRDESSDHGDLYRVVDDKA